MMPLQGVSLVTAPYTANGQVLGVLGVIGPKRMAYDRVIPLVQATADARRGLSPASRAGNIRRLKRSIPPTLGWLEAEFDRQGPSMNHEQPDIESQQSAADAYATAGVNDEVERLRAEIEQVKADALRERADLENQRKRVARDIEQARKFANEKLLGDLLPRVRQPGRGLKAPATTTRCAKAWADLQAAAQGRCRQRPGPAGPDRPAVQRNTTRRSARPRRAPPRAAW